MNGEFRDIVVCIISGQLYNLFPVCRKNKSSYLPLTVVNVWKYNDSASSQNLR